MTKQLQAVLKTRKRRNSSLSARNENSGKPILRKINSFIGKKTTLLLENSFSSLRKNFFKFGIELFLLAFAIFSAGINFMSRNPNFTDTQNRYLEFLAEHPTLNKNIADLMKTQKIQVLAQKESFVSLAQAADVNPISSVGNTSPLPADQNPSPNTSSYNVLDSFDGSIIKPNYATKDAAQKKDIQEYTVKNGDSVSRIAGNFGVSVQTILYENKINETDPIHPGQVLKILPTTGIKHTVQKGETIEQIAKKYQVDQEVILDFNEIEIPEDIDAGEVLIIPNGKVKMPESQKSRSTNYNKVDIKQIVVPQDFMGTGGQLIWPLPIRNITQRFSSRHKAVDISDGQRPQFWAAQDGIVELSGWQGGYGRTIVINHGNGIKTRYGHASELYVSAGDQITAGQIIGRVGNTGRTYGTTGNHLHFEVIKNGTKVNPASVAK